MTLREPRRTSRISELRVDCVDMPIQLRRHPSARRLTLRVNQVKRCVTLTIPPGCNIRQATRFVEANATWIDQRLRRLPDVVALEDGAVIPLRGVPHTISFAGPGARGPSGIGQIWVGAAPLTRGDAETPLAIMVAGPKASAPKRLRGWLIEQARRDLSEAVQRHAQALGLRYRSITLRDQATRWGSCSSTGALSFSWRLIFAQPLVLDYVAAHEVAHLREMNHSSRFWDLVRETMPRMDEAQAWLRCNGAQLHRFAPRMAGAQDVRA